MIHTCTGCKNYVHSDTKITGLKEVVPGVLEPVSKEIPAHCSVNDDVRQKWLKKYGKTPINQLTKDMELPCFAPNEYLNLLDGCIKKTEEILANIKK